MGQKPGELRKPSSRKYRCLLTVVYARHKPGELRKPSSRKYRCLLTVVYAKYSDPLTKHYQQQPTVRGNKPDPSGGRNQEEALEVDRTHIEEITQLHHKASLHLESSKPKDKRKTKEHTTPRNGDRHGMNKRESDRTRKEGPGQNGLENTGRRPMLHWE
ncbi:unnamed protein product [Schistosoma mattheei]|uniref:Uncharacterized protein n=1 Tax=Schistosoma mattheei TaxID=31246 RepID=A0A183NPS9_9TREM|nr:unnamed protein product [Schistosoma mattheei]